MKRRQFFLGFVVLLAGCAIQTGSLNGQKFEVDGQYVVELPGADWEVERSKVYMFFESYKSTAYLFHVRLNHKKSNGFIEISGWNMDEAFRQRSLEVIAENAIAKNGGMKLSEKSIKSGSVPGIEVVMSGPYMIKFAYFKAHDSLYRLLYRNTPAYFDAALPEFDHLLSTFQLTEARGN